MKIRKNSKIIFLLLAAILLTSLISCMPSMSRFKQKYKLYQQLMTEPDLPTWQEDRKKVVQSFGDRIIDKSFGRVFDSIITALGSLELTVQNMERESGYIIALGIPSQITVRKELEMEELREYCRYHSYDPSLLDDKDDDFGFIDPKTGKKMTQNKPSLSFSLVEQTESQTKVKIRVANILYPATLEEVYKVIWREIDKQIFLDKSLD
ncbi:MAG: hypothetical protein ACFFC7_33995 [Candidatus Hermodarchaeota archaeon]